MSKISFQKREHDFKINFGPSEEDSFDASFESGKQIIVQNVIPLPPDELSHPGDFLCRSDSAEVSLKWVPLADRAEEDNTAPISSAAVYTEIGNINALLHTI